MHINTGRINQQVRVLDLPTLGILTIKSINDCGVRVEGSIMSDGHWKALGPNYVISGTTLVEPADSDMDQPTKITAEPIETMNNENTEINTPSVADETIVAPVVATAVVETPAVTYIMEGKFTAKEFATKHSLPYAKALNYLKIHARVVEIRKSESGRGRPSTIYTFEPASE